MMHKVGRPGRPRIAICHETRPLFVTCQNMGDPGLFNPTIKFDIVDAGNPKDHIHAPICQHARDLRAERSAHHALQNCTVRMT